MHGADRRQAGESIDAAMGRACVPEARNTRGACQSIGLWSALAFSRERRDDPERNEAMRRTAPRAQVRSR